MALVFSIDRYNRIGFNCAVMDGIIDKYEKMFGERPLMITLAPESLLELKDELGLEMKITSQDEYQGIVMIADTDMALDKITLGASA